MKNILPILILFLLCSCEEASQTGYKTIESSKVKKGALGSVASSVLDSGMLHMQHSVSLHKGYKVKKKSLWRKYDEPVKKLCTGSYCY